MTIYKFRGIKIPDEGNTAVILTREGFEVIKSKALEHNITGRIVWRGKYHATEAIGPFKNNPELKQWVDEFLGWESNTDRVAYVCIDAF